MRPIVAAYQNRRRTRLMERARQRVHEHAEKMKEKRVAKQQARADRAG